MTAIAMGITETKLILLPHFSTLNRYQIWICAPILEIPDIINIIPTLDIKKAEILINKNTIIHYNRIYGR